MSSEDPLSELVLDAAAFDRTRIVDALRGRLALDDSTSQAVVLPGFDEWDSSQKTLSILLLRKAAVLLERASDGIGPSELADQAGTPGGTVRRILGELLDSHRVSRRAGGAYFLSSAQVGAAIESLTVKTIDGDAKPTRQSARKASHGKAPSRARTRGTDRSNRKQAPRKAGKQAGRSPTALVKELCVAGFFDQAKTLGDVQRRLKDKSGHKIPVTTLSPILTRLLRAGQVDRELGEDGVYAYVTRS